MRRPSPLLCMAAQLASCLCVEVKVRGTKPAVSWLLTLHHASQTSLISIQENPWSPTSQPPFTLCCLTAWPSVRCCSLDWGHWKSRRQKKEKKWSQIPRKHKKLIYHFLSPFPWLPRKSSPSYALCSPVAYLQNSSKTIQTITHSNIDGFPKDAVSMFWISNHLRVMRMSMKPQVCKEEYLALGKNRGSSWSLECPKRNEEKVLCQGLSGSFL